MSWNDPTFADLLASSAEATSVQHRAAANALLAREWVARERTTDVDHDRGRNKQSHFAYAILETSPISDDLNVLLSNADRGSDSGEMANRFLHYGPPGSPGFGISAPRTPGPASTYNAELATIIGLANSLKALVIADLGSGPFAAARAPYVTALQARFPGRGYA